MRPSGPLPALLSLLGFLAFWLVIHWREQVINKWSALFAVTLVVSHVIPVFIASKVAVVFAGYGGMILLPLFILTSSIQPTKLIELFFVFYTNIKAYLAAALLTLTRGLAVKLTESVQQRKNSGLMKYLVGFLVSIPVILLLVMLLSSDPIFYQKIKDIIPENILAEIPGRIGMSTFMGIFLIPTLYLVQKIREHRASVVADMIGRFHAPEISLMMSGLVTLVLGAFIVIQWPYIFVHVAREIDLQKYGVRTYSEYVTKGFVELIIASVVVLGVISLALIVRNNIKKMTTAYGVINLLLIACYSILIISCFRRVGLYVELHGLSVIRVYGSYVLAALLSIVPFILLRFYFQKAHFFAEVVVICCLFVIMLGTSADHIIATQFPPTVNKQIDYGYLARLSADGADGWEAALISVTQTLVTKNLLGKPLLDSHDRQEIAKAALTLAYLKDNYSHLQDIYLSVDEYNTNRILLLQSHLGIYQNRLEYLNEKMKTNKDAESEYKITLETSNKIKACMIAIANQDNKECLSGISIDSPMQSQYMPFTNTVYPNFNDATFAGHPSYFYNMWPMDNSYDLVHQGYRPGYYSQWYSYNKVEKEIFDKLDKVQYPHKLYKLMSAYYLLEEKIISQPLNERSFEQDVSLAAPLL